MDAYYKGPSQYSSYSPDQGSFPICGTVGDTGAWATGKTLCTPSWALSIDANGLARWQNLGYGSVDELVQMIHSPAMQLLYPAVKAPSDSPTGIPAAATYIPTSVQGSPVAPLGMSTAPGGSNANVIPSTTNVGNNSLLNAVQGAASGVQSFASGLGLNTWELLAIAGVGLFVAIKVFGGGSEHRGRY